MKFAILIFLSLPLPAAMVSNIRMTISADGNGPQASCSYSGPGPTADCTAIGPRGQGQAFASVDGGRISVAAGGNGVVSSVYVTATLDALYYTAFTGNLFAMFDYQCSAGGSVVSGAAGMDAAICGAASTYPSSQQQAVALPVNALDGQLPFTISWFAVISTLGDQEYANSNLSFLGFQDAAGNAVAASITAPAAATLVPEPGTWALAALGLALLSKIRK